MRLVVITAPTGPLPPQAASSWVLRLTGIPVPSETPPPESLELADKAAARVRAAYPQWLWQWANDQRALSVAVWPGPISWWWFCPVSEMSPMRTPFIRDIYWLTLLDVLIQRYPLESIEWIGNDAVMAEAAEAVARKYAVSFTAKTSSAPWNQARSYHLLRRLLYSLRQLLTWICLRALGFQRQTPPTKPQAALSTRYPILWEESRERMYGTWPDFLRTKGQDILYGASYTGHAAELLRARKKTLDLCRLKKIVLVEALVPFKTLLAAHFPLALFRAYRRWKSPIRKNAVVYDGLEVRDLWWRQMDADVLSLELPFARVLSEGWRLLLNDYPSVRTVFFPFEFQPMERAIWCGAKSGRDLRTVGVQTGLFCSNQMGFSFLADTVRREKHQAALAPLPDDLAAYGDLPYKIFADRLGGQHVFNSGPLRYAVSDKKNPAHFLKEHGLPEKTPFLLLAGPALKEEALRVLDGALQVLRDHPDVFLLAKFHYHRPLHQDLRERARAAGVADRYKIFDSDLQTLMFLSTLMMTGGSSTGIEAMAQHCMPVVYRPVGEMPCNPMMDVPDAAFFWSTSAELASAAAACLEKSAAYEQRRRAWPQAIAAHMSTPTISPNERLYTSLGNLSMISL